MAGLAPFTVFHVCMGNICRSPMAECLFVSSARRLVGDKADELLYSHGGGTDGWHQGDPMDPQAARQVRRRGGEPDAFRSRRMRPEHIEASDLILTATFDQVEYVTELVPDAEGRTFALGQMRRLLASVDRVGLPPFASDPDSVYLRGVAVVEALDAARARDGARRRAGDEIDDPWSRGRAVFDQVADEIEGAVAALASVLLDGADSANRRGTEWGYR